MHDRGGDAHGRVDAEDPLALDVGDERQREQRDEGRELPFGAARARWAVCRVRDARPRRDVRSM